MSKTEWFPGYFKPVHVGVYERRLDRVEFSTFSFWDGKTWKWSRLTPEDALNEKHPSLIQQCDWRGLCQLSTL
jgi:hypothetical protein